MRISDWSSDVCSSDLLLLEVDQRGFGRTRCLVAGLERLLAHDLLEIRRKAVEPGGAGYDAGVQVHMTALGQVLGDLVDPRGVYCRALLLYGIDHLLPQRCVDLCQPHRRRLGPLVADGTHLTRPTGSPEAAHLELRR